MDYKWEAWTIMAGRVPSACHASMAHTWIARVVSTWRVSRARDTVATVTAWAGAAAKPFLRVDAANTTETGTGGAPSSVDWSRSGVVS